MALSWPCRVLLIFSILPGTRIVSWLRVKPTFTKSRFLRVDGNLGPGCPDRTGTATARGQPLPTCYESCCVASTKAAVSNFPPVWGICYSGAGIGMLLAIRECVLIASIDRTCRQNVQFSVHIRTAYVLDKNIFSLQRVQLHGDDPDIFLVLAECNGHHVLVAGHHTLGVLRTWCLKPQIGQNNAESVRQSARRLGQRDGDWRWHTTR